MGDALLSLDRIVSRHGSNEGTQFRWYSWLFWPRLPAPEQSESCTRCHPHPMKVFGLPFTKASFHANPYESSTDINLERLSKRSGLTCCPW